MKQLIVLIIAPFLIVLHTAGVVRSQENPVTPYGDCHPECGKYGACKAVMTDFDAEKALKNYYDKKGFLVKIEDSKGRFIKAKILDYEGVVDIIIFDRQTGRIRSIY